MTPFQKSVLNNYLQNQDYITSKIHNLNNQVDTILYELSDEEITVLEGK